MVVPKRKYPTPKKPVYGNNAVYHPDGFLMFCCSDKKATWYLSRNLAVADPENPQKITLTFVPKGDGRRHDKESLVFKKNICVCCGHDVGDEMNRHHIVPYCYRRNFPDSIKRFSDYDVVCICFDCHEEYELAAWQLKKELSEEYGAPFDYNLKLNDEEKTAWRARQYARTLSRYRKQIPQEKINTLEKYIAEYLGKAGVSHEEIDALIKASFPTDSNAPAKEQMHGYIVTKKIMEKPNGLQEFFLLWRKHFIENMKPQFMPADWDVNLPIRYAEHPKKST